jgi:Ca2+-binding RTX toxin-like protein
VLTAQGGGSNLSGGAGDDTLVGGTGSDTLTGQGGADHFAWNALPWSAARVTDFTDGVDKLDLSGLLASVRYAGSDPVADGYVKVLDSGHGDAWLYFDSDGPASGDPWGTFVATLEHTSAAQITGADLAGGGSTSPPPVSPPPASPPPPPASPPPPPQGGVTLHGQAGGSALQGGTGDDTLIGGAGPDTMTGQAGADHFTWSSLPWSAARVTDFTHGADRIDLSGLLTASHYAGLDPIADGYVKLIGDGHGNTWLYFDTDGRGAGDPWGTFVATLSGVSPSALTISDFIFG